MNSPTKWQVEHTSDLLSRALKSRRKKKHEVCLYLLWHIACNVNYMLLHSGFASAYISGVEEPIPFLRRISTGHPIHGFEETDRLM